MKCSEEDGKNLDDKNLRKEFVVTNIKQGSDIDISLARKNY